MSNITWGYISSYKQNTDGTYSCQLLSYKPLTPPVVITPSIPDFPMVKFYDTSSTITTTVNCIGILNSNIIISPNDPGQFSFMSSSDNKYCFIPLYLETSDYIDSRIKFYYLITYTVLKYNSHIPLMHNYLNIMYYTSSPKFSSSDSTYNSITNIELKKCYGAYLTGINPPPALLNINPNLSQWSDVGYMMLAIYEITIASQKIDPKSSSSKLIKGNGIIPDNICVTTDSPNVIPAISAHDCRNVTNGTPFVLPVNTQVGQSCGSSSSSSSSFCSLLCIVLLVFSGATVASSIDNRRNRRYR